MNNLLFYALLMVLLYYFFIYLPSQKKSQANNRPLQHHQATQTEPIIHVKNEEPGAVQFPSAQSIPDPQVIQQLVKDKQELQKDISQKEKTIIGLNNSYSKLETKSQQELDNLKKELEIKEAKIKELTEIETSVDQMIKNIKELNEEIEK